MLKPFNSYTRKNPYGIKTINRNSLPNSDITGSLEDISEPTKYTKSQYRINTIGAKTINEKTRSLTHKKQVIQLSAKQIEKQITSFDSVENKLFIANTELDYDSEQITNENFELFYNGASVPFIYNIEQVGNDVVITLSEEYIDYDGLSISQVFVSGKFK